MKDSNKETEKKLVKCPECLRLVEQEELDTFNGFCENCQELSEEGLDDAV